MKVRVIKNFYVKGDKYLIGDIFYVNDGGILLDGEWLCDDDSPFAKEFFEIVKE